MALEYRNVTKAFGSKEDGTLLTALKDVSFTADEGEFVAIVGPSGCGKSTMLNMTAGLYQPTSGEVHVSGELVTRPNSHVGFMLQKDLLLPWRTIEQNVCFGLEARGVGRAECRERAAAMLDRCHLHGFGDYYPHQLSGGMRQRVAIATALLHRPAVIIADEPTTALDVSIQSQILAEVRRLADETGTAIVWITHDLAVISSLADDICVMYAGRIVERGAAEEVIAAPRHPYTVGLIGSVPSLHEPGAHLPQIPGSTPQLANLPSGCPFRPRCPRATDICATEPPLHEDGTHSVSCHHPMEAP